MEVEIDTPAGTKVVVTEQTKHNGWPSDERNVERYLVIGTPYTIDHLEVHSWHTRVYLTQWPHIYFNSVNFEIWQE